MNFIFFGRLAKEKGFDLIVRSLVDIVGKTGELPGNVAIFGEGDMKDMLFQAFGKIALLEDYSRFTQEEMEQKIELLNGSEEKKIYFFGWQSQEIIRNVLRISHFSLMPSRFLETFGLSALESLSEGVPVIGFQKGGLVPFIPKELAIPFSSDDTENIEALSSKLLEVSEYDWSTLSHKSRHIADQYTEERWMEQVRDILPRDTKKILLASDYTTILGGIETHMQTIARVLRQHGFEVEVFGWDIPKGKWTRLLRFVGLIYSLCNITTTIGIRKKIRDFEPDAVWLHSVNRFLGPLVVREVNRSKVFSLVTYHDLGLLSPFPSRVESEEDIPKTKGIRSFLGAIKSNNPIIFLAVFCKYLQIYMLRNSLKNIHIHIVPSSFLIPYIRYILSLPEEKTAVLEHFL